MMNTGGGDGGGGSGSGGDLIDIQPPTGEIKFQLELKKQSSSCVQITNKKWDEYVAFKIQTTNPKKYCVKPNTGILLPKKTCDVTITMQAQKETPTPTDLMSKDKFLLRSVAVPYGATTKDITPEMFNKEAGMLVEEFKWRVVYVIPADPPPPPPPMSVPANPSPSMAMPVHEDVMKVNQCQICDMNSHLADSCPFLYTPCKIPNCSGIRKLYVSKIEHNPRKKFLKCQYNQCMGFQLLSDAILEANGSNSSSTMQQKQELCFQCGDTTHSTNECPMVVSPSIFPAKKDLKTSEKKNKKKKGEGRKFLKCFGTRKRRT